MFDKIKAWWKYYGETMSIMPVQMFEPRANRKHSRTKLRARYALRNGGAK